MDKLSKRKHRTCKEHHRACDCREVVFKELLLACNEALEISSCYDNCDDELSDPSAEIRRDREIVKITDHIREAIRTAFKNNELVNEVPTDFKQLEGKEEE